LKKYTILTGFRIPPKDYEAGKTIGLSGEVAKLAIKEGWAKLPKDLTKEDKELVAELKRPAAEKEAAEKEAAEKEKKAAGPDKNKMAESDQNKGK